MGKVGNQLPNMVEQLAAKEAVICPPGAAADRKVKIAKAGVGVGALGFQVNTDTGRRERHCYRRSPSVGGGRRADVVRGPGSGWVDPTVVAILLRGHRFPEEPRLRWTQGIYLDDGEFVIHKSNDSPYSFIYIIALFCRPAEFTE